MRPQHYVYDTDLKNKMVRFVQKIKERTECCDDKLPSRRYNCDRKQVCNWLNARVLYLHLGKGRLKFIQSILIMEDKSTELCVNLYYWYLHMNLTSVNGKRRELTCSFLLNFQLARLLLSITNSIELCFWNFNLSCQFGLE